jgi:hypothetical protein
MNLSTVEKRRASTAIEYTYRDYTKEGGLKELQTKVDQLEQGCAGHIYSLAQFAVKQTKNLKAAADRFGEMCEHAEAGYKNKHEVKNLKDVLPVWSVYKSNILRGMRLDMSPLDHATEGAFRIAVGEVLRQAAGNSAASVETTSESKQDTRLTVEDADDLLDDANIHEGLRKLVARLMLEAAYVKIGREAEAEAIVQQAVDKLHELVDRRRITHKPTRTALSAHLH